ncbi:MAG: hypothetical protein GWN00_00090, partial [Aliifodinibius sp.]|nr:hypothetical protein [Fodinibius sp.]NIV09742.1 hypothetical protein [Fodinibius sp.]NIY23268.1 hypothetical protein [Fodinibius sp.]
PKLVDELIVIGARIKTEVFEEGKRSYDNLQVLALHGERDKSVKSKPQQESCKQLSEWGADVAFKTVDSAHKLDEIYLEETQKWMKSRGYKYR